MATVTETLVDGSGTPLPGRRVTAYLVAVGYDQTAGSRRTISTSQVSTTTDTDGAWSLDLVPNADIESPAGTYYVVKRDGAGTVYITVGTDGGILADLLTDAPADLDVSALVTHQTLEGQDGGHLPDPGDSGNVLTSDGTVWSAQPAGVASHPDLATHDALGLATQAELDAVAAAKANTSHSHTEADITDLGVYPDATGQAATKVPQTDGAGGWTFIDTPSGGGGTDDQTASEVLFTPTGTIAATDVQSAVAEVATDAAAALSTHEAAADPHPGYLTAAEGNAAYEASGAVATHAADTTGVHGIADTSALLDTADIGVTVQGYTAVLAGTTASFTTADETKLDGIEAGATADQTASEVPVVDAGGYYTGTDVEAVLQELGAGGSGQNAPPASTGALAEVLTITEAGAAYAPLPPIPDANVGLTVHRPNVVGHWYDGKLPGQGNGAVAYAANIVRFMAFRFPNGATFDQVNVAIVTATGTAGATALIGLYSSDPDTGLPDALITEWGTVPIDTTAPTAIDINFLTEPNRVYWVGMLPSASGCTFRTMGRTAVPSAGYSLASSINENISLGYSQPYASGLPASLIPASITFADNLDVPSIRFRLAGEAAPIGTNAATFQTTPSYLQDSATPDATGQTVHPSVIDFGSGNTWNGYRYWMAYTGYKNASSDYENPIVVASTDGATWVEPAGITNPITEWPGQQGQFHSDTDLVYDAAAGVMWLVYRFSDQGVVNRVVAKSSSDGVTWSAESTLLESTVPPLKFYLSPSVLKVGSEFWMWTVEVGASPNQFQLYKAPAMTGPWTLENAQCAITVPSGQDWWHPEVFAYGGNYYAYVNFTQRDFLGGAPGQDIRIAKSTDGETWTMSAVVLGVSASGWDNGSLYRASGDIADVGGTLSYRIWYSAKNDASPPVWHIGYTTVPVADVVV